MKTITLVFMLLVSTGYSIAQSTWNRIDTYYPGHTVMDFRFLPGFAWYHLDGSNPAIKGIYKSTDDGTTWTRAPLPVSSGGAFDQFKQIHYFNSTEAIIVYYDMGSKRNEFHYTSDDGATQTLLSDTVFADYVNAGNVSPSPGESSGLIMLDRNFGYGYTYGKHLASGKNMHLITVTRDGGKTWEDISIIASGNGGFVRQLQFLDDQNGFLSISINTADLLLKTTDGGSNWTPILTNSHPMPVLHFLNVNEGYVIKEGNLGFNEMARTTDGGQTWTTVFDNSHSFQVYNASTSQPFKYSTEIKFFDANKGVYAGAANAGYIIASTSDGGNTWTSDSIEGYSGQIALKKMQLFSGGARGIQAGGLYGNGNVSFSTSSVEEISNNTLGLYPNPSKGNLNIECKDETSATVFNLSGVKVMELRLSAGINQIRLDLPAGIYFISSEGETQKLLIDY